LRGKKGAVTTQGKGVERSTKGERRVILHKKVGKVSAKNFSRRSAYWRGGEMDHKIGCRGGWGRGGPFVSHCSVGIPDDWSRVSVEKKIPKRNWCRENGCKGRNLHGKEKLRTTLDGQYVRPTDGRRVFAKKNGNIPPSSLKKNSVVWARDYLRRCGHRKDSPSFVS